MQNSRFTNIWNVADDAQVSLFNKIIQRTYSEPSPMASQLNTCRAYNFYFIVLSQAPRDLSDDVMRNSSIMMMDLPDYREYPSFGRPSARAMATPWDGRRAWNLR